jgi:hypothetical protein
MKKLLLTAALLAAVLLGARATNAWAYGSCGVCSASGGYSFGACVQCGIERLFAMLDGWD